MGGVVVRRPNILLITLDQWRGDCLRSAGHLVVETPNLDRLAAEGVRFNSHYSQTAPCGPSRASLLTGTYQHVHRSVQNGTPLDARFTNVALEARAAGYDPLLFGHTDTTVDPRTVSDDDPRLEYYEGALPGFRVVLDLPEDRDAWYRWLEERGHDVSDRERFLRPRSDMATPEGRGASWPPPPFAADETETAFLVGEVIEELERLEGDGSPWFVHASIYRPHPPFVVPEPYNDLVDPASVAEPIIDEAVDDHPFLAAARSWRHTRPPLDPGDLRQLRATYYGMMAEVDAQVGRLLGALDDMGATDDTIVVVTSDHGEMLGDHGLMGKLGFFDQAFHIPLVIRYPPVTGNSAGTGAVVEAFTENVDVMPTLLDLAGIEVPRQCQGSTLRPWLEGTVPDEWRTAVHWEFDFRLFAGAVGLPGHLCNLAVHRDQRGKYVHFAGWPAVFYDLEVDPAEQRPLVEHPEMAGYAASLLGWRMSTDDEVLADHMALPGGMVVLDA
ncbi:MAG: sulfatase-like hydrolase/transferase [Acidimicrobiaceae bacterium]|nr:sulfatase-like hydrolase/transferase [Acidimicrobiaceae bacterium]